MHVLGSAGHVDHGKSSLLRALTGMEPDRLPEEKRRGMTIDLNFVWLTTSAGKEVGIVDVPGHHRFVKNMISGTMAVDAALFVCAADDGWMPQSEEHLTVLKGFGVKRALGIVSKADLVDGARVEAVVRLLREKLEGALGSPVEVIPFSAVAVGPALESRLTEIRHALDRLLDSLPPPRDIGLPRVWIDRVFVPKGLGVVATGTLREGMLREGDELELVPLGRRVQVKSVHSHHRAVPLAAPNARVALQLKGVAPEELHRGMLLQLGKRVPLTSLLEAKAELFSDIPRPGRYRCFLGSVREEALVVVLEMKERRGFVRLRFPSPVPARSGDPFVLRTWGEERMVAAGVVIDPLPTTLSRERALLRLRAWREGAAGVVALALSKHGACDVKDAAQSSAFTEEELADEARRQGLGSPGGGVFVDPTAWDEALAHLKTAIRARHEKKREALSEVECLAALRARGETLARRLLEVSVKMGAIRREARGYTLPELSGQTDPGEIARRARIRECLRRAAGQPLAVGALETAVPGARATLRTMVKDRELVGLPAEHFIEPGVYAAWQERVVAYLRKTGSATTSDLRVHLQTSRKNAVVVLEQMDRDKLTYLKDNVRRLFRP